MSLRRTSRVVFTAIGIYQFDDGKLEEDWIEYDALGLLRQVGAIPPLGEGNNE